MVLYPYSSFVFRLFPSSSHCSRPCRSDCLEIWLLSILPNSSEKFTNSTHNRRDVSRKLSLYAEIGSSEKAIKILYKVFYLETLRSRHHTSENLWNIFGGRQYLDFPLHFSRRRKFDYRTGNILKKRMQYAIFHLSLDLLTDFAKKRLRVNNKIICLFL